MLPGGLLVAHFSQAYISTALITRKLKFLRIYSRTSLPVSARGLSQLTSAPFNDALLDICECDYSD